MLTNNGSRSREYYWMKEVCFWGREEHPWPKQTDPLTVTAAALLSDWLWLRLAHAIGASDPGPFPAFPSHPNHVAWPFPNFSNPPLRPMSLMQLEAREPALTLSDRPKCFAFLLCTGHPKIPQSTGKTPQFFPHPYSTAGKNNKRGQHELKIRFLSHFVLLRLCWPAHVCVCLRECASVWVLVLVLVTSSGWLCASLADVFMKSCD